MRCKNGCFSYKKSTLGKGAKMVYGQCINFFSNKNGAFKS